jgi:predicted Zn-dependent peptidase
VSEIHVLRVRRISRRKHPEIMAVVADHCGRMIVTADKRYRPRTAFAAGHGGLGTFGLYAGCSPAKAEQVEKLLVAELERLADGGITESELFRSAGQLRGSLVLWMEDSGSRMSRLGRAELVYGELYSLEESLDRIRAVTREDVRDLAQDLATRPRSTIRVGPFGA